MKKTTSSLYYFLFIATLFNSCKEDNGHTHEHVHIDPQVEEANVEASDKIEITQKQFDASGYQLGKLERRPFASSLTANGRVHLPEKNKAIVSSYVGGTVDNMDLIHGQWVKKGSQLFTISTPELIHWQQDLLEIQSQLKYLQSEVSRQKILADEKITAQKNYLKADAEYKVALSKKAGLSKKLSLIGIDPNLVNNESLRSSLPLHAPISGYITAINVTKGSFLNSTEAALEISNTNHLHIELKVLERDMHQLKREQTIRFKIQGMPDATYLASIHQIEKLIDENRMINIHAHLENDQKVTLIPGMSIEAEIELATEELLSLPASAVVAVENENFILVQDNPNTLSFTPVQVKVLQKQDGFVAIDALDTAIQESAILIKGAYFLYSGTVEAGVITGHSH